MGVREASSARQRGELSAAVRAMRAHWRTASLASGWPFPSDWALPEVDTVCVAAVAGGDLRHPLADLGRARSRAGACLEEALSDLAALHAVLAAPAGSDGMVGADPDAAPAPLLRAVALGWADGLCGSLSSAEVTDGLTGLRTPGYLRARLGEVYAEATLHGAAVERGHVLLVLGVDFAGLASAGIAGLARRAALALLADVLRAVFDGGETLAVLGPSVLVALTERDERLGMRAASVRWLAADWLQRDPALRALGEPRVWLERLPVSEESAQLLLEQLGRS